MQIQFNEVDLHIEMTGEPCEMSAEQMADWFKKHIESLADNYEGGITVEVMDTSRRTRNIGVNEM